MKKKTFRAVASVTAILTALAPTLVAAQAAPQTTTTTTTTATPAPTATPQTAAQYFGTVEYVRGIQLRPEEYDAVRTDGCFIGPANLVAPLMARLDRRGEEACSRAMFDRLDTFNREGSTLFMVIRVGDGLEHCVSTKGISLTNNRIRCATYSFDPNSDGRGRYASDNYSQSGGAVVAQTFSGMAQAFVGGPATALTAGLMQRRNCCGQQTAPINNVVYAVSNSDATAGSNVAITGTGACLTGTCED